MCALRFKKACVALALAGFAASARAQVLQPLRVGEKMPAFTLSAPDKTPVSSRQFWGKQPEFWIVEGDTPLLSDSASTAKAAARSLNMGIAPLVVQTKDGAKVWPAPFQTLRDETGEITKILSPGTFVAVDRAGWIRDIESLPSGKSDPQNFALRFLLERSPDPTPAFAIGKPAPDFCVPDSQGIMRRLSSLRGRKNLVLTFFPKCFTGKCKSHLGSLRDNYGAFQLAETEVWAVSVDAAGGDQGQRAFAESLGVTFPLLPDEGRNLCLLYGAVQIPTELAKRQTVLIDKDGIVRWIDRDVAPLTHGEDTLARLKTLGMIP